jgi:hypothetical protein
MLLWICWSFLPPLESSLARAGSEKAKASSAAHT